MLGTSPFPRRESGGARAAPLAAGLACVVALAISGCAEAGPYNPGNLDAASLGRVQAICAQVMRLRPGEAHFGLCVESLSAAAAARGSGQSYADARTGCLARGLQPGTPALAQCELEGGARAAPAQVPVADPEPRSRSSYEIASNAEIFRREQLSCARLGLEPAGRAFGGCVASLEGAMTRADDPSH